MKKNGKYCNGKKSMNMKPLAVLLALTLLVGCAVGGTIAWLTAQTSAVENTFTVGDINITLQEHELKEDGTLGTNLLPTQTKAGNAYHFVPGDTLPKDPFVTVDPNSEACYLFVKVTVANNAVAKTDLETVLHFTVDDAWNPITNAGAVGTATAFDAFKNGTYYFYQEVDAATAKTGFSDYVLTGKHSDTCATKAQPAGKCNCGLENGYIYIDPDVTKEMVKTINGDSTATPATSAAKPTLTFKAAAIQSANIANLADAWTKLPSEFTAP